MKAISLSRKFWILFSTILIVAAIFGFYFLIYVSAREDELKEKKFRALEQYAVNVKDSYKESSKKILEERYRDSVKLGQESDSISLTKINKKANDQLFKAKQDIVNRLARDVTFDEIVVEIDTSIIFQSFQNTLTSEDLESILKKDTNVWINRFGTFRINDQGYFLFIHQFQLSNNFNDFGEWRMYGFSRKDYFQQQTRAVELIVVLFISLILIVILIAMPMLKLLVMNDLEKLNMVNIWFTGFSVIVGSSFIVLTALVTNDLTDNLHSENSYDSGKSDNTIFKREQRIEALSNSIQSEFSKELQLIFNQLESARDTGLLYALNDTVRRESILKDKRLVKYLADYRFFNEILWICKEGDQQAMLATYTIDLKHPDLNLNLRERKYFSWVVNDSTWKLPCDSPSSEAISLQSIHSYGSGNREAGIGIRWEDGVLAIATHLSSVMDPLLPPGYQFCIFDRAGKVWFHSTTTKNLQENFLDETNHPGKLKAAITGRVSVPFDLEYEHKKFRALVTPMPNMDLFLVTMHDSEYYSAPIVLTSGFALILIFLILLIQGIHQLIIYLCSVRYSQLRIRTFFLDWLRPRTVYSLDYQKSAIAQFILLLVLGLIANFISGRWFVICILALPVYLATYHCILFKGGRVFDPERPTSQAVFLRQPIFIASLCFILIINMIGMYYLELDGARWLVLTQVFIVGVLASSLSKRFQKFYAIQRNKFKMDSTYVLCLFVWLTLVAVLPTYYFYKVGYREEGSVWTRYLQLEAAKSMESRETIIENEFSTTFEEVDIQEMLARGNYLSATTEIKSASSLDKFKYIPDARFYELIFQGRPVISGQVELSRSAIFPTSRDKKWWWLTFDKNGKTILGLHYNTAKGQSKYYFSEQEPYRFSKGNYWIVSLIGLIIGFIGMYRILQFCIKHIFGIGLLQLGIGSEKEITIEVGMRYFIVGLPYSGKNRLIEKIEAAHPYKVKVIDLRTDKDAILPGTASYIILKHFEFGINDHSANTDKLKIFTTLRDLPNVGVICLSNIEPQSVLEFYDKQAAYYSVVKHDRELEGLYRKCNQALRNWKNVLSGFKVHYKALEQGHALADPKKAKELDHGEFLPTLETYVNLGTRSKQEKVEAIIHIEEMSQNYYHSLWNSFCNTEKFILYDLAKDGFVNMRNMKIIRILMQKGIIRFKDSLKIMNASFNNFILSVVNEDEEMKMEQEMRAKGSWNTLHLVLVISIISIIVFLGIAQQTLFKNFEGILAAVVTLLPLLARFSGIFGGSKMKD